MLEVQPWAKTERHQRCPRDGDAGGKQHKGKQHAGALRGKRGFGANMDKVSAQHCATASRGKDQTHGSREADPYSSYVNFPCSLSFRGNTREKPLF